MAAPPAPPAPPLLPAPAPPPPPLPGRSVKGSASSYKSPGRPPVLQHPVYCENESYPGHELKSEQNCLFES